jgi:pheromone shutdown protein TraB
MTEAISSPIREKSSGSLLESEPRRQIRLSLRWLATGLAAVFFTGALLDVSIIFAEPILVCVMLIWWLWLVARAVSIARRERGHGKTSIRVLLAPVAAICAFALLLLPTGWTAGWVQAAVTLVLNRSAYEKTMLNSGFGNASEPGKFSRRRKSGDLVFRIWRIPQYGKGHHFRSTRTP